MPTDRELMQQALDALEVLTEGYDDNALGMEIDAIEALRARLAQPEPEPVAWLFQNEETGLTECVDTQQVEWGFEKSNPRWQKIAPLYTVPPQREWQGLTDEEIYPLYNEPRSDAEMIEFARAIEQALKEKNA